MGVPHLVGVPHLPHLVLVFLLLVAGGGGLYMLLEPPQDRVTSSPSLQPGAGEPVTVAAESVLLPETPSVASQTAPQEPVTHQRPLTREEPPPRETAGAEAIRSMSFSRDPESVKESKTTTEYRADIEQDEQGITIVLHTPADAPSLLRNEPAEADVADRKDATGESRPATGQVADTDTNPAVSGEESESTHAPANPHLMPLKATAPPPSARQALPARLHQPKKMEIIHIVVRGDTLWAIAARYVNDPYLYPELARLSRIKNPDRIYPGDRVRIIQVFAPDTP